MVFMNTVFILLVLLKICVGSWLPSFSMSTSLSILSTGTSNKLDGNTSKAIDVSLYSRQLLVYGETAQHRINNAHVAVLGSGLLATEVIKTIALAGVGRLSVIPSAAPNPEEVSIRRNQTLYEYAKSLNNNIMVHELTKSSLTRSEFIQQNFTAVIVTDHDFSLLEEIDLLCKELNIPICAAEVAGVCGYIFNDFHGNFHVHDVDGEEARSIPLLDSIHTSTIDTTNTTIHIRLSSILEEKHNVGLYDTVEILHSTIDNSSSIQGRVIKVIDTHTIEVLIESEYKELLTNIIQSGKAILRKMKESMVVSHKSLQLQLLRPTLCMGNECLPPKHDYALSLTILACFKVYQQLTQSNKEIRRLAHNQMYEYWRVLVVEELKTMGIADPELSLKQKGKIGTEILNTVVSSFIQSIQANEIVRTPAPPALTTVRTQCPACVSIIGAMVAQEVLKAITHMYIPITQFFMFQALDALEEIHTISDDNIMETTNKLLKSTKESKTSTKRTSKLPTGNVIPYNQEIINELKTMKVFIVGAGAIGCELLKNFALLGVGIGRNHTQTMHINENSGINTDQESENIQKRKNKSIKREDLWSTGQLQDGGIIITDMDSIERSNLNRQLLFREEHIGQYKAQVAVQQVVAINPRLGGRVLGLTHRLGQETEAGGPFDAAFWKETDVVVTALDNVNARQYVDEQCVRYRKWLLDSGTLGTKGNTQVVIPHVTESYSASADPEDSAVPICTIKTFPYQPEHCVAWAKNVFEQLFTQDAVLLGQLQDIVRSTQIETAEQRISSVTSWLNDLSDEQILRIHECIIYVPWNRQKSMQWAQSKFTAYYTASAAALLREHPTDALDEEGQPFWGSSRRIPQVQTFDPLDPLHIAFVNTLARLRMRVLGGSGHTSGGGGTIEDPVFNPVIHPGEVHSSHALERENLTQAIVHSITHLAGGSEGLWQQQYRAQPEEFDKDDESLGHVDAITALTNLRCRMYGIQELNRLQVQKIAGNIIPALASTTSVVAGIVTIELIKIAAERVRYRQYLTDQQQQQKGELRSQKQRVSKRLSLFPPISGLFQRLKPVTSVSKISHIHRNHQNTIQQPAVYSRNILQTKSKKKGTQWTKSYLVREKSRLLNRFRNSFMNLARPMLAFAQPQEAEAWSLSDSSSGSSSSSGGSNSDSSRSDSSRLSRQEQYTLWDTITIPGKVRSLTLTQVREYLHTLLNTSIETISYMDTLLYASFDPESELQDAITLYDAIYQGVQEGSSADTGLQREKANDTMDRVLLGKDFILLQVTTIAVENEGEEGGGGSSDGMRLPPIKVYI